MQGAALLSIAALALASRTLDLGGHKAKIYTRPSVHDHDEGVTDHDEGVTGGALRQLADDGYGPMRIKLFYSAHSETTSAQLAFLKDTLVPTAVDFWGRFLHVPQVRSISIPASTSFCYDAVIPDDHKSSGVTGGDYLLYVTADNTSHCGGASGSDTLAYAGVCVSDASTDRPLVGFANFCPQHLSSLDAKKEYQITTAIHEMAHAFGFASGSLKYYRHPNGTARVPRDTSDEPILTTHTCSSGSFQYPQEILKLSTERGHLVPKVITEAVVAAARDFFNCATLDGAELENQDPTKACGVSIGSHWEERLFGTDFMSAIAADEMLLSPVTLALFEDMGWYRVQAVKTALAHDGSAVTKKRVRTPKWGYKMGCAFTTDKCITSAGKAAFKPFCDTKDQQACSADYRRRGICTLAAYSAALPAEYQYFADPAVGGLQELLDYCPVTQGFTNGDCRDASNAPTGRNYQGVEYKEHSRCVESSMWQVVDGYQLRSAPSTACYDMACRWMADSKWRLYVKVIRRSSVASPTATNVWVECNAAGEAKTVNGFEGELTCPPPDEICSLDPAVGQTMQIVNATPAGGSSSTVGEAGVDGSIAKLGKTTAEGFSNFKAGTYQQGWAVKMLASARSDRHVSFQTDEYRDNIKEVWIGAFMAPMVLLIVLVSFLTVRMLVKKVRDMEARSPFVSYMVVVLLVVAVGWTFGATGGASSLQRGVERVAASMDQMDQFFNESLLEANRLVVHGARFNDTARDAGCVDSQLTDEMAYQGELAIGAAGTQLYTLYTIHYTLYTIGAAGTQLGSMEAFVAEVKGASFEAGPDSISFNNKNELQHKYEFRVAAYVYTIQAFVLIAAVFGIVAMLSKNWWLLHLTTFIGVIMLLLTAFSFSIAVTTSVVLTDFCVETPENSTLRMLAEGRMLSADNMDIASYYLRCGGRNPMSEPFNTATDALLLIENATTVLLTLKMPSLDLSAFANGTNESAYKTAISADGHKLFTLSADDELVSGIDLEDIPAEYRKYFTGGKRRLIEGEWEGEGEGRLGRLGRRLADDDWYEKYANRSWCNNSKLTDMQVRGRV
jgi:leishmanolysin-like peptidase